jgi:hypothetical protein
MTTFEGIYPRAPTIFFSLFISAENWRPRMQLCDWVAHLYVTLPE